MNFSLWLAIGGAALALVYAAVATFRRQKSRATSAFAAGMLVLAGEGLLAGFALSAPAPIDSIRWHSWRLVVMTLLAAPWVVFSVNYARGGARSRPVWKQVILGGFSIGLPLFGLIFRDDLIVGIRDRFAFQTVLNLGWPALLLHFGNILVSVFVLNNFERTYRAAFGTVRWRIKFTLLGLGLVFIVRIYTSSQALIVHSVDPALDVVNAAALVTGLLVMFRSLARSGHFEMDVYPSPAVLRSSLTVVLVGTYLVLIGLVSKLTDDFGGKGTLGVNAFLVLIALVALAIALQSAQLKLHVHRFISRHFERPFYDYRTAWRSFTESTATQLDQTGLCRTLNRQAAELFQANSVSIWLTGNDAARLICAASTSLVEASWPEATPDSASAAQVLSHFRNLAEPTEFEDEPEPWGNALRRCHPKVFNNGGNRIAMPLVCRGTFLGLLLVGDRVNGDRLGFSVQDLDMLRCVGNHVAASLLNIRLSERLVQSREVEAFQAMAAFFVHDLKNAASTLNLMLPNLPIHWDNPEFREDTLRGITKTVERINSLIGRLTELRQELKIHPKPNDLNAVIEHSLEGWKNAPNLLLIKKLTALSPVQLDADQFHTVVNNLILNARDAILQSTAEPGVVTIETASAGSFAVVTVADNGCGMSQNFLNNSLFKPFQTTKKNGIGIGMFQSKMIVEAHGGRLSVESVQGKGTVFRVFVPLDAHGAGAAKADSGPTETVSVGGYAG